MFEARAIAVHLAIQVNENLIVLRTLCSMQLSVELDPHSLEIGALESQCRITKMDVIYQPMGFVLE
ncbi:hypothetical protein N7490_006866 [Penicillium lividum]|nr:hypothetical protein N7490_006866 [Penicillium lividum]